MGTYNTLLNRNRGYISFFKYDTFLKIYILIAISSMLYNKNKA